MAKNELVEGNPRLGWLIDGDPDTPEVAVMLHDTGKQITLTVPTKGMADDGPYFRWFMAGVNFSDDPNRTKYSYMPPRVLMFADNNGSVILVGCRALATNFGSSDAGNGTIVANYAILGGRNLKYDKINGLRSELPGLAQ